MNNILFNNALNRVEQKTPPIWFMRQAGRYHNHYQKLKEKYSFEDLCKTPELASEVACGPVEDFDFDIAILFSDILFPLEGLGMPLKFDPGPVFGDFINSQNYQNFNNVEKAMDHMLFQSDAIKLTREKLHPSKSLIGFVGGLWTLLQFATDNKNKNFEIEEYHFVFMKEILLPLIKRNIQLQLDSGAEIVMMFDSGLNNLDKKIFVNQYINLIADISNSFPKKIGYYLRGKEYSDLQFLFSLPLAGIGINSEISISKTLTNYKTGFIQGNFDQKKLLMDKNNLREEMYKYCEKIKSLDIATGWVCSLGHGIDRNTPEENVHLFIDIIRKEFK